MSKEFVYIDSSQDEQFQMSSKYKQKKQNINYTQSIQRIQNKQQQRYCLAHNPEINLLKQSQYDQLVRKLLRDKIDKETEKALITNIEDAFVVQNINKRNANYKYFLEKMEIDQNYRAMQQQKADKLKKQNERKKKVLYKVQNQNQMERQQAQLKKIIVEKGQKQEKVVQHIKKQVKKLGFERIYNAHRKMKQQIKAVQAKKENQIKSKINKQRDQILQLQAQFQAIKQEKRINKLQQRKVIKQLSEKMVQQKQLIQQKLRKGKFEV